MRQGEPSSGNAAVFADVLELMPCAAFEAVIRSPEVAVVTYMNASASEMFGIELEQAVGRTTRDLVGVNLPPPEIERMYAELTRGDGYYELESARLMKAGEPIDVRARVRSRLVGESWRMIGTLEDITDARRLRVRVDVLMALIDLAPDAILAIDGDQRLVLWNKGAEALYGFTREEALGRDATELLSTRYPVAYDEFVRAVIAHDRWKGDLAHTAKDGRRVVSAASIALVRDKDHRMAGVLGVHRDLGERLALEAERERARLGERLARAERLESLGQLAGGIAHDFNNVLAVVAGYAAVIGAAADGLTPPIDEQARRDLRESSGEITRAVERAGDLTRQLLAFARQESVENEPVSLNDVVADLEDMLRRALGDHIELETRLAPAIGTVMADPGQLGQVLVNLAVNSRDAMPEGGRLVIETANVEIADEPGSELAAGAGVQLRVSDTGCGMPRDVLEHAFEPFFTTKSEMSGTGLGLATVYGIVTQAGGRAHLYSEPGIGTTFSATFPAVDVPLPRSSAAPPAAGVRAPVGTGTVLLVEDQAALRAVTARILSRAGYRVHTAASGPEALELAETSERIDVLVTDVVMSEMLGQQLAERLRETRPRLPVIFTSGFARPALEHASRALDGPLLQKPFSAGALLALVAESLDTAPRGGP